MIYIYIYIYIYIHAAVGIELGGCVARGTHTYIDLQPFIFMYMHHMHAFSYQPMCMCVFMHVHTHTYICIEYMQLLVSSDGDAWRVARTHTRDGSLVGGYAVHTWPIQSGAGAARWVHTNVCMYVYYIDFAYMVRTAMQGEFIRMCMYAYYIDCTYSLKQALQGELIHTCAHVCIVFV
jgi:hypothetical protein